MILVADDQETFLRLVRLKDLFRTLKAAAVSHLDGLLSFLAKASQVSWEFPHLPGPASGGGQTPRDHLLQIRVHLKACWEARPGDQLEGGAANNGFGNRDL